MHIQTDEYGGIVRHGLPPSLNVADIAPGHSACGSAHFGAQPTIRLEADRLQPLSNGRLSLAGWGPA
jgi:hypothetical protein